MNDDLIGFRYCRIAFEEGLDRVPVNEHNTTEWNRKFNEPCPIQTFIRICQEDCERAEKEGVWLAGFTSNNNPLFRDVRFGSFALVDGRAWLVRKGSLRFDTDPDAGVIEDHFFTAKNIEKYGKVQIDRFVEPNFSRMTRGGYGSIIERADELRRACALLIRRYPYLFAYKNKKGYPPKTQVRFKNLI